MSNREEAQELLSELISCMPKSFYNDLDATKKGAGFILGYLLQSDDEVIAGDFSKMLNVSTARIAALLKKMEHGGLITRRNSSKDARRTVVELTPAGIAFAEEMKEQALMKVERLLNRISKEELKTFIQLSLKIREVIDE